MTVSFHLDTNTEKMILTLLMLKRLLKIQATVSNSRPVLMFYLMGRKIMVRTVARKPGRRKITGAQLLRAAEPHDISVSTSYGFRDPFTTGIVCGAIDMAAPLVNVDSISNNPDFQSDNDYIHLDATASVDTGTTLLRLLRARSRK